MSIDPEIYSPTPIEEPDRRILATSSTPPGEDVIAALEEGLVNVVRRVEIYEADGQRPWNPDLLNDPDFSRIISGNVTVDYNADERRVLDLTLDNRDQLLRPDPLGGLWYDKIIKVFRGVSFVGGATSPKVAIADTNNDANAVALKQLLHTFGYTDVDILTSATTVSELQDYPVIFSYRGVGATTKSAIYTELWNLGHHIFTLGSGNRVVNTPHYTSESQVDPSGTWRIEPTEDDSPVAGSFASAVAGVGTGWAPLAVAAGTLPLALGVHPNAGTPTIAGALVTSAIGGHWVDLHAPSFTGTEVKNLLRAASNWVRGVGLSIEWLTQIGEFMIDGLVINHFPDHVKVTGRDYVKKMKMSKLGQPTTFAKDTKLRDMVTALAVNAGIDASKMRVGISNEVLTTEMAYDAGTDRWSIAKEACTNFNYEIFFDAFGWFVVRKFIDPFSGPISWTLKTGEDGNLVSFDKAVNDSEIYNHITVTATPSDDGGMPFFGEAKNTDPTSPTRIERIGHRVLPIQADYLSSDAECKKLAEDMLKIKALEQYALNTSSVYYPWLEVGEIHEILDPDALELEPTKYLVDTLNFPIDLGPMSGTAKRITFVGDSGNPENGD